MELFLNLAWVLLALPCYWLWRRNAGIRECEGVSSLQCLLALGCTLVLLFPVISATDDLHAMRAEMEDSASSKRTVRQAGSDRNLPWVKRLQGPPAAIANADWVAFPLVGRLDVLVVQLSPWAAIHILHAGRAPPFSFLR
jgi:hypothetical protein